MIHSKPSPIVEFLGKDAGAGGPFALLGLPHRIDSAEQIIRACNRRLHQIDHHQHRSTPDAGEVRLAVHAAASQLLDPALKAELAARWPEGVAMSVPKAWKPAPTTSKLSPGFLRNARLLIAASGGWNATARKRLAHFAKMNRVAAVELVSALCPPKQQAKPEGKRYEKPKKAHTTQSVYLIDPPPNTTLQWFAVYGLLLVVGGAVLMPYFVKPLGTERAVADSLTDGERLPQETQVGSQSELARVQTRPERESLSHYTAIAHELDQLVVRSQSDLEGSVDRFIVVYPQFIESWEAFPEPAIKRSALHIAEIVQRVSGSDELSETLRAVFGCQSNEDNPSERMIRAAVIDVVLSDPRLSTPARNRFESLRERCSSYNARANQDVIKSLVLIAGLEGVDTRTDDLQWWTRWINGVRAATSQDQDQRTRLVLSAMSARLRDQSLPGESWKKTVIELVNEVSWREGESSRYWLLSQFSDHAVTTARLAWLTEALATSSGAKQIDAQMVLNPSSTFLQRQELAQAYARAWSTPSSGGAGEASAIGQYSDITHEMRIRVSITPTRMDLAQSVQAAIEHARLNTAAWQFVHNQEAMSAESLTNASGSLGSVQSGTQIDLSVNQRDSLWAQDALGAKDANELRELFSQLVQADGPGVNSAYALVYLATLHANNEIRGAANRQIIKYKHHPSVLLALDHAIGGNRISVRLEQLVLSVIGQSLPERTDERWFELAHRVLLGRLALALAQRDPSELTILEEQLGAAYSARLAEGGLIVQQPTSAIESIRMRYRQLFDELWSIEHLPTELVHRLDRVESAHAIRIIRSQSPMHRFLAYQRGLCELMGVRIEHQIAGGSFQVGDVLSELDARLKQAQSISQQIAQAERCLSQLWILWLEGGGQ